MIEEGNEPGANPMMIPMDMAVIFGLTMRQAAFVYACLGPCRYNATRSAIQAGFSPRHPRQSGHQAMQSPKVGRAVETLFRIYLGRDLGQIP